MARPQRAVIALAVGLATATLAACGSDPAAGPTRPPAPATATSTTAAATPAQAARATALLDPIGAEDPGCAVAVRRGDELVWTDAAGRADLDAGTPIGPDTVFDIASSSKLFTATLVLDLVASGELALDDTVGQYLDGLPAWADEVTIDQLLHHTAGIPDYIDLLYDQGYVAADRTTTQDALDALAAVELEDTPGRAFAYSNSGYFLLAEIVTAVTGEDVAEVMAERVFARHDLDAVLDPVPDDPRRAHSYVLDRRRWEGADSAWEQVGDGGVQTTPVELVRWAGELWDPRHPAAVGRLRLAGAVPDTEEGGFYGAGVVIDPDGPLGTTLSHPGGWAGFVSDLVVVPDGELAAAVTCNTPDLVDPTSVATSLLTVFAD